MPVDAVTVDGARRSPRSRASTVDLDARYQLIAELGRGGMAVVHAALDRQLGRRVALKVVRPDRIDATGRARLLREAQSLARLRHPNVVQVYDAGELGPQVFIAMELVDGGALGRWLATAERPWQDIVRVFVEAGRGLAAAHAAGLVHRDFKPDNVLIDANGHARVADFGLAVPSGAHPVASDETAEVPTTITRTGAIIGTPSFMAPEQLDGQAATTASDQFAFCVALYRALYGKPPFAGDTPTSLRASIDRGVTPAEPGELDRPRWIRAIVARGLAVQPGQRHASMDELLALLSKERGWRRWRIPILSSVGLLGTAAAVVYAASRPDAVDPVALCDGGASEMRSLWSRDRRDAVKLHLAQLGGPLAPEASTIVDGTLDRYARDWSAMHRSACVEHARGAQSARILDLRMSCVAERATEFNAAVDGLLALGVANLGNATAVAAGLPPIADCGDVAWLEQAIPALDDSHLRAAVLEFDRRLAVITTLERAGDSDRALALLAPLIVDAKHLNVTATTIRAALIEARILIARDAHKDAKVALQQIEALALRRQDLAGAVEAAARLVYLDGVLGDAAGAAARVAFFEPLSEGLRGDHFARPLLLNNIGTAHLARGDVPAARAYFEHAHAALTQLPDPALELLAIERNLALTTDAVRGAELARRVWNVLEARLGRGNLLTLDAQNLCYRLTGDPVRALAIARDFLERAARFHPTASALRSDVASYAGFLAEEIGDLVAARAFYTSVVALVETDPEVSLARALAVGQLALLDHDPARATSAFAPLAADWAHRATWWERERGAVALTGLAAAAEARGDDRTATASLDLAITIFLESVSKGNNQEPALRLARTRLARANLARKHGDPARADALEAEAVAYYRATGAPAYADEIARHGK